MQVLHLSLALSCVISSFGLINTSAREQRVHGIYVSLSRECPPGVDVDRSVEVVSFLQNGITLLNGEQMSKGEVEARIIALQQHRTERVVWVNGEAGVTYGDVFAEFSHWLTIMPNLNVALLTPVLYPAEPRELNEWMKKKHPDPFCVYSTQYGP